ncbi:hypothetical protein, partial [Geothermobacter hydrogeniphilus]|uniref:hypothetical protein n=1 Tax=Geothermobacter hydrogeniphilus TaxID=1969733 RepID=UPI001E45F135
IGWTIWLGITGRHGSESAVQRPEYQKSSPVPADFSNRNRPGATFQRWPSSAMMLTVFLMSRNTNPVADAEAGHQVGVFRLGDQFEPLDDQPVEKQQGIFAEALDRLDGGNTIENLYTTGFHSLLLAAFPAGIFPVSGRQLQLRYYTVLTTELKAGSRQLRVPASPFKETAMDTFAAIQAFRPGPPDGPGRGTQAAAGRHPGTDQLQYPALEKQRK